MLHARFNKLLLLQAIIAEFGKSCRVISRWNLTADPEASSTALRNDLEMPQSLTQCTIVLKSELHINIKLYLEWKRGSGVPVVQVRYGATL